MNLTIAEAARRFRDGSLSPSALTDDCLARIARENPRLNAFYEVFADGARAEAARAGRELRESRDRGPLQGIPIGIKDLFDVAGSVTTAGAHPGFHPPPAETDSDVVRKLREAGAVILGKTALHEWALGVTSNNAHFGPTRNPHDPERVPGGSSGGSGAAVAAGLCPGAIGSDTGGSIRIPAALCGVVGLKPSYGLVSLRGVCPLSGSLDHAGPMASTVEDVFLMLEAISGFRRAPVTVPRILVPEDFGEVEPEIAEAVRREAARRGRVERVALDLEPARQANSVMLLSDAAAFHEQRLQEFPERFGGTLAERFGGGLQLRAVDYARARETQRRWRATLEKLLGDHSVLALPGTPIPAPLIGDREGAPIAKILTRFTSPFNLAGTPVLSVPIGRMSGLPFGMQLVAAPGRESLLYAAGDAPTHPL